MDNENSLMDDLFAPKSAGQLTPDASALFTPQERHRENYSRDGLTRLEQRTVVPHRLLELALQHLVFDTCFATTYQGRLAVVNVRSPSNQSSPFI